MRQTISIFGFLRNNFWSESKFTLSFADVSEKEKEDNESLTADENSNDSTSTELNDKTENDKDEL